MPGYYPKTFFFDYVVFYVPSIVNCSDADFRILLCTYCWLSYLPTAHITCKCSSTLHFHAVCLQLPQMVRKEILMCLENLGNLEMHCAIFRTAQHHFNWDNFTLIRNSGFKQTTAVLFCSALFATSEAHWFCFLNYRDSIISPSFTKTRPANYRQSRAFKG